MTRTAEAIDLEARIGEAMEHVDAIQRTLVELVQQSHGEDFVRLREQPRSWARQRALFTSLGAHLPARR